MGSSSYKLGGKHGKPALKRTQPMLSGKGVMTDRELLELAAKAAGLTLRVVELQLWNPLDDSQDALDLAVKLDLHVLPFPVGARVRYQNYILDTCEIEIFGDDKYAATRRAIVQAAAEIGKYIK